MNLRASKKLPFFLLASLILIISGMLLFSSEPVTSKETEDTAPTLFIHGFNGTKNSFGRLIDRFEQNQWADKSLVIGVSSDGQLSIRGTISQKQKPMIHLVFEENKSSIARQTEWLDVVMETLHDQYHISQVNIVAHSMGGLTSVSYLLHNQDGPFPEVQKLVAIGSPFWGINHQRYATAPRGSGAFDLHWMSPALQMLADKRELFDKQTTVMNIAGVINETGPGSDGLVRLESARGLKEIVPPDNYKELVFYKKNATHSGLHELPAVDQAIAAFLWNIQ